MHAARLGAFRWRALAAPHPFDPALEQRALVAAREIRNRDFPERRLLPEVASAEERRRARSEKAGGGREGELSDVGDAGVGTDEQRSRGNEVPELGKIQPMAERLELFVR